MHYGSLLYRSDWMPNKRCSLSLCVWSTSTGSPGFLCKQRFAQTCEAKSKIAFFFPYRENAKASTSEQSAEKRVVHQQLWQAYEVRCGHVLWESMGSLMACCNLSISDLWWITPLRIIQLISFYMVMPTAADESICGILSHTNWVSIRCENRSTLW